LFFRATRTAVVLGGIADNRHEDDADKDVCQAERV